MVDMLYQNKQSITFLSSVYLLQPKLSYIVCSPASPSFFWLANLFLVFFFSFIFRGPKSVGNLFVPTSAVKKSFEMVVLAVSQKWPVLLYGPAGAGKSALINKLTLDSGNEGMSVIFLSLILWFI